MAVYPRVMINIPKQHRCVDRAIDKIAKKNEISKSKVIVAILIDFLKRTDEIKVTSSYDEKYKHIRKVLKEAKYSETSKLIEV